MPSMWRLNRARRGEKSWATSPKMMQVERSVQSVKSDSFSAPMTIALRDAPARMAWSTDNRTCGFRIVGQGKAFRIENRMPGADANPYLAFAAMLAAGRAGVREGLDCGPAYEGNAYVDTRMARLPSSLAAAADLLDRSEFARAAFGDGVVDFHVRHARLECDAFGNAVTDWEKRRYFEQI